MRGKRFCTVPEAIRLARRGKLLILVDGPERENEADFFVPADAVTPKAITTMIKEGSGVLCVALEASQARRLGMRLMVPLHANTEQTGVNFTVSANARHGVTTGASAQDRARTIRTLASLRSLARDVVKPGHVLGLVAREGGLRVRQGHTEAAVELARLAGRTPAGALCEIVGKDGRMAHGKALTRLSRRLNIPMLSITDLVRYLYRA